MAMTTQDDLPSFRAVYLARRYGDLDDATYDELIAHEKWLWDHHSAMRDARKEGREEGREEGARSAAVSTARNILRMETGLSVEEIAEVTGLSLDEVAQLAQDA